MIWIVVGLVNLVLALLNANAGYAWLAAYSGFASALSFVAGIGDLTERRFKK